MESALALPQGYGLHEYRIESTLGVGGFGVTYLATDTNLARQVAIKEYLPSELAVRDTDHTVRMRSSEVSKTFAWGRTRFLDESRTLAGFHHPNIVRVMRFFEANQTAYMVMEFVEGQALNDWILTRRPLPQSRAAALAIALLDGLAVVHRTGYLHRDIKPANIFMRADDSPVLLDFGSARAAKASEMTAIVTPGYAPLEQYHEGGNQGPWSDIYSVGAMLYWLVIGTKPVESVARARTDPLVPAVRAGNRARYSEDFLAAIDWALAPAEEKRPQSVAQLREAIAAAPPVAGSDSPTVFAHAPQERDAGLSQPLSAPVSLIEDETQARLIGALARHIGPIAAVTLKRTLRSVASTRELIETLADEISDDDARTAFTREGNALLRAASEADGNRTGMARSQIVSGAPPSHPMPSRPAEAPSRAAPSQPAQSQLASSRVAPSQYVHPPSQPLSAPLTGNPARPERPLDLAPETLAAAEKAIVKYNGAISKAIVKRAAARARDETEFHLIVADSIEDAAESRAYLRKFMSPAARR
ncbi:MAG: protein kinase domain-containing protein [Burkholderiales bacterium]